MMFLLDQGLPRSAARVRQAVVVTLDADFHRLLAIQRAATPSVIRIRIEGLKGDGLASLLQSVVNLAANELAIGPTVSVTKSRVRVHMLPIGKR